MISNAKNWLFNLDSIKRITANVIVIISKHLYQKHNTA
jgi:hypothetical protein